MNGYKAMIRDRCPYVINIALKWCTEFGRLANQSVPKEQRFKFRVKERWIERVYKEHIAIYTTKDEKNSALHKALGLHGGKQNFNFADSINLELINANIDKYEKQFWIWVNSWVNWFIENYKYIENAYTISSRYGNDNWKQFVIDKASYLGDYIDDFIYYLEKTFNK